MLMMSQIIFVNDLEHFGSEAPEMFSSRRCLLLEGVGPNLSILIEHLRCAHNANGVNEIDIHKINRPIPRCLPLHGLQFYNLPDVCGFLREACSA